MNQPNNPVGRLKQMLALEERRSALQAELDSLVQQLNRLKDSLFDNVQPAAAAVPAARRGPAPGVRRGGRRGVLKEKIMAALTSAGSAGVRVKELAVSLGTKPVNIHSWFHSALKGASPITKITGGHYRLGASSAAAASAPAPARRSRRRGTKRGQLTATILSELKAAGPKGVSVGDIAKKLGANYRNVYIWFATTGKKFKEVKKVAPATYKIS